MSDAPERVKAPPGEPGEATELRSTPGSPGHLPRLPGEVVRRRAAEIESQMNAHFQTACPTRSSQPANPPRLASPHMIQWVTPGPTNPEPFQRPAPGQAALVRATITEAGVQARFPAVFSMLPNGTPLLFAFSRSRLGMTYYGEATIGQGVYTSLSGGDTPVSLGSLADIPPELMTAIMSSIYAVETSSNPPERLESWKVELHAPNSQIRAEEACTDCGRIHLVNLTSLRGVRNVAQGITCPQFGATCLFTTGSSRTPLSSAAAPILPHSQETYHTPSMGNPHVSPATHYPINTPCNASHDTPSYTIPSCDLRQPIPPRWPGSRDTYSEPLGERGGALCVGKLP